MHFGVIILLCLSAWKHSFHSHQLFSGIGKSGDVWDGSKVGRKLLSQKISCVFGHITAALLLQLLSEIFASQFGFKPSACECLTSPDSSMSSFRWDARLCKAVWEKNYHKWQPIDSIYLAKNLDRKRTFPLGKALCTFGLICCDV